MTSPNNISDIMPFDGMSLGKEPETETVTNIEPQPEPEPEPEPDPMQEQHQVGVDYLTAMQQHVQYMNMINPEMQGKAECKSHRIRVSPTCAARLSQLTCVLGHQTKGDTVEWLLVHCQRAINEAIGKHSNEPISETIANSNKRKSPYDVNANIASSARSTCPNFGFPRRMPQRVDASVWGIPANAFFVDAGASSNQQLQRQPLRILALQPNLLNVQRRLPTRNQPMSVNHGTQGNVESSLSLQEGATSMVGMPRGKKSSLVLKELVEE